MANQQSPSATGRRAAWASEQQCALRALQYRCILNKHTTVTTSLRCRATVVTIDMVGLETRLNPPKLSLQLTEFPRLFYRIHCIDYIHPRIARRFPCVYHGFCMLYKMSILIDIPACPAHLTKSRRRLKTVISTG